jgi:predicted metal-dependent phosphoesterase TrpH
MDCGAADGCGGTCGSGSGCTYEYYFGNTHSHTKYSDGDQTPADHFALAKSLGFDFYMTSDHALAKYSGYTSANWQATRTQAAAATTSTFVAIAGFEFSENDDPAGHANVFNPATTLDASASSVNLSYFYDWLVGKNYVASFNHPSAATGYDFNNFAGLTTARRNVMTMAEVFKASNESLWFDEVVAALDKGWRVAPVVGIDNHTLATIETSTVRTGVLATSLSVNGILAAMRERRVFATRDKNLRVSYVVNGRIMGSVLSAPTQLAFKISVLDPDSSIAGDRITQIDILTTGGAVAASKTFNAHAVYWTITLPLSDNQSPHYYWLRVFAADRTPQPTAFAAPVWVVP